MWGALSNERAFAAGPHQRSHSWGRVPKDLLPPSSVSNSRFPPNGGTGPRIYICQDQGDPIVPHSSPSMTRRNTAEVLEPTSTPDNSNNHLALRITFRHEQRRKRRSSVGLPRDRSVPLPSNDGYLQRNYLLVLSW